MTDHRGRAASARWWLPLLGLPVLCCAGTTLIAALGAGSVTAAIGGLAGNTTLAAAGAAILPAATVLVVRRRIRR